MSQEKLITKKDLRQLLDGQAKAILNVVDKKLSGQTKAILNVVDEKLSGQTKAILNVVDEKLSVQTKTILSAVDKKIDEKIDNKIDGLAVMMKNAFQTNQDYTDKKFSQVDERFKKITDEMNGNFAEVKKQIDGINRNIVDVVHQEDFDKLETRVTDVEEILKIPNKKFA